MRSYVVNTNLGHYSDLKYVSKRVINGSIGQKSSHEYGYAYNDNTSLRAPTRITLDSHLNSFTRETRPQADIQCEENPKHTFRYFINERTDSEQDKSASTKKRVILNEYTNTNYETPRLVELKRVKDPETNQSDKTLSFKMLNQDEREESVSTRDDSLVSNQLRNWDEPKGVNATLGCNNSHQISQQKQVIKLQVVGDSRVIRNVLATDFNGKQSHEPIPIKDSMLLVNPSIDRIIGNKHVTISNRQLPNTGNIHPNSELRGVTTNDSKHITITPNVSFRQNIQKIDTDARFEGHSNNGFHVHQGFDNLKDSCIITETYMSSMQQTQQQRTTTVEQAHIMKAPRAKEEIALHYTSRILPESRFVPQNPTFTHDPVSLARQITNKELEEYLSYSESREIGERRSFYNPKIQPKKSALKKSKSNILKKVTIAEHNNRHHEVSKWLREANTAEHTTITTTVIAEQKKTKEAPVQQIWVQKRDAQPLNESYNSYQTAPRTVNSIPQSNTQSLTRNQTSGVIVRRISIYDRSSGTNSSNCS